jgi:hypothetical protein
VRSSDLSPGESRRDPENLEFQPSDAFNLPPQAYLASIVASCMNFLTVLKCCNIGESGLVVGVGMVVAALGSIWRSPACQIQTPHTTAPIPEGAHPCRGRGSTTGCDRTFHLNETYEKRGSYSTRATSVARMISRRVEEETRNPPRCWRLQLSLARSLSLFAPSLAFSATFCLSFNFCFVVNSYQKLIGILSAELVPFWGVGKS